MICTVLLCAASCGSGVPDNLTEITDKPSVSEEAPENLVKNSPSAYALANNLDRAAADEPFSFYTYDFSVMENNYMITVTPDENGTGLTLTVEDNRFGFSKFSVTPPAGYMVCLPYSQQYASQVCTVIKSSSETEKIPDLLKIDFYLMSFEDESLPYTVSRLYSIINDRLVEVEVYDTCSEISENAAAEGREKMAEWYGDNTLELMEYIPESVLYHTESLKFMPEPVVTVNEDGSLSAEVITYTLNPNDMTMRRAREDVTPENTLYYGYAVHAIAGNIYQYFIATSLNVSDYENYVEVPSADGGENKYFFKVDDPRFSTKAELQAYVSRYFDEKIVSRMFLKAPQQYRDINGELYTILGDGGINEELGKVTITNIEVNESDSIITYHTKQEKFNSEHVLDGYVDGGDFVVQTKSDGSFIVKEYRYPTES